MTTPAPEPTDEQIAAAVAALVAALARRAVTPTAGSPRSAWANPTHGFRRPLHPAPGAWAWPAPPGRQS
ncbi:MAG: acyl-CoA carboxylase epsilon subunit [Actinomycetales bacterium]